MKSIILYPQNDRYVLKRVFKIFNSFGLKVDAVMINREWTVSDLSAVYGILDTYSHIFVILSSEYFKDIWFTGLLGYLTGSNKGNFFYFTENNKSLDKFFSKFNTGQGYDCVETYAESEIKSYNRIMKKEDARNHLIDTGFALSEDSMGECVSSGNLDMVKKYIDAGFTSSSRNTSGVPMLCIAVRTNHMELVQYLIDIGADINAISEDRNNTPIMDAASAGDMESIKLLVGGGADLETQSKNGQTALILAVGHGDIDVSNFLIHAGADYEIKDSLGMSAKSYANLFKKSEILENMK